MSTKIINIFVIIISLVTILAKHDLCQIIFSDLILVKFLSIEQFLKNSIKKFGINSSKAWTYKTLLFYLNLINFLRQIKHLSIMTIISLTRYLISKKKRY